MKQIRDKHKYDINGTKFVSYTYDAWGNFTTTYHNGGASTTAVNNPFRYRGYYYDEETGLYYLNSRYYDPVAGRFISADSYVSTGQGIIGNNMYAYCNNNPIMYTDPSGEFLVGLSIVIGVAVSTVVGSAIGAAFEVATTIAENPEATSQEILASMTEGAISGGFMGLASGVIAVTGGTAGAVVATYAAAGFVGSFGGSIAKSAIRGEDMSTGSVYINAGIDGLWGAAFGVLAGGMEGPVEGLKTLAIKYGTSLSKQAYKFAKRSITKIGGAFLEGVLGSFNDLLIEQYIEEYIGG